MSVSNEIKMFINLLPLTDLSSGSDAGGKSGPAGDGTAGKQATDCVQVVRVQGLDTLTVVGISFAAFIMGVLLTAALWLIHTHTGEVHAGGCDREICH